MTEPPPTYSPQGEVLDPATRDMLAQFYKAMWADGISIVVTAERAMEQLGVPVETAVVPRGTRRKMRISNE